MLELPWRCSSLVQHYSCHHSHSVLWPSPTGLCRVVGGDMCFSVCIDVPAVGLSSALELLLNCSSEWPSSTCWGSQSPLPWLVLLPTSGLEAGSLAWVVSPSPPLPSPPLSPFPLSPLQEEEEEEEKEGQTPTHQCMAPLVESRAERRTVYIQS